ncbi:unnamed protein product, partial [Amoebophrya sp. A120]|eukprot:GSA120T00019970001.1
MLAVMDGKVVQTVMTLLTVFALYGDDLRMKFFFLRHDIGFYVLYTITFFLFSAELTIFSVCKEDYKYSFFFWLDMVASMSILPDIKWVMDFVSGLFDDSQGGAGSGQTGVARAGRASRAGTRAGRIVLRLIRLVRLLRVVNIAKFFSKEEQSALDKMKSSKGGITREGMQHSMSKNAQTSSPGSNSNEKRVEASRLGKILSEQTTRTVILGVLCMMLVLPMIELEEPNRTPTFGLEQIFWIGRSSCSPYADFVSAG